MTHLDSALVSGSGVVIPSSDSVGDLAPQSPRLPLALLLDRLDGDLGLGYGGVSEDLLGLGDLADTGPGSFVVLDSLSIVGQSGLVRVSLTGDPS